MLFLLRHCERDLSSPYFDTSLLPEGFRNAENKVLNNLQNLKFDKVYCSPFIRCLQTIKPFLESSNTSITVDYLLMEWISDTIVKQDGIVVRDLTNAEKDQFNIEDIVKNNNSQTFPENYTDIQERVRTFLAKIQQDENILICTHECIVKEILNQTIGFNYGYHRMGEIYLADKSKCSVHPFVVLVPYIWYCVHILRFLSLKEQAYDYTKSAFGKVWRYSTTKLKVLTGCS